MEHDAVSRNARAERERELAGGGDVGAVARAGDELEDRDARKRLDAVEQERVGGRAAIRLGVREERLLAVDDERRAELLGEARRRDATERELAVSLAAESGKSSSAGSENPGRSHLIHRR